MMHSDMIIIRHHIHPMVEQAYIDSQRFHDGQVRRYDKSPYWTHTREVASILIRCGIEDPEMLAAAHLHDIYEDTNADSDYIRATYGDAVHTLIDELTERQIEGNRAFRKAAEATRLAGVSERAQTIKCADLISNTADIVPHDPNFARVYILEKAHVLNNSLLRADLVLWAWANRSLLEAETALA